MGAVTPPGALGNDQEYTVTSPIAFSNTCGWAGATLINLAADKHMGKLVVEVVGFSASSGSFFSDLIGGAAPTQAPNDGFYWIAIGF